MNSITALFFSSIIWELQAHISLPFQSSPYHMARLKHLYPQEYGILVRSGIKAIGDNVTRSICGVV